MNNHRPRFAAKHSNSKLVFYEVLFIDRKLTAAKLTPTRSCGIPPTHSLYTGIAFTYNRQRRKDRGRLLSQRLFLGGVLELLS